MSAAIDFALFTVLLILFIVKLTEIIFKIKRLRRETMDDSVDFDDWERGSPDRFIPNNAKKIEL